VLDEIEIVENPAHRSLPERKQAIETPKSKLRKIVIMSIIGLTFILVGTHYYIKSITYVSTDDAYVEAHAVQVAPKVSGNVIKVYVDDNQKVKEGQLIAEIDPRDYQIQYNQAVARLESAITRQKSASVNVGLTSITSDATAGQTKAGLEQANHDVSAARAEMNFAQIDYDRYIKLYSKGVVSKQDFDKVSTNYKVVHERLNASLKGQDQAFERAKGSNTVEEQVAISNAQLKGANAEIKQLKAAVDQAKLNLSYTKILAPQSGKITGKNVEKGSYLQIGQPMLVIVPEKRWIVANFKETQLEHIKVGQPVFIKVDAYPNKRFLGQIDSFQSASGSKASLFPPENAVGSFVKVVQRVPVKIIFTEKLSAQYTIVPGMSVIPEVKVR
jgi:membrane fusion protein, multidrug efflux system